jgi:hypothetical protein
MAKKYIDIIYVFITVMGGDGRWLTRRNMMPAPRHGMLSGK